MDGPLPAPELSPLKGEITIVEPDRAQRAIARRSAETRATVPDLELGIEVDADACLELAAARGWSVTAQALQACAVALREFPLANAAYRDGRFELYSRVNIGVTIATDHGQVVPTVLDADAKSPAELDDELARLRARAHTGELTPPELAGATFTFSDLGEFGVHRPGVLITPPQAAAVAAGAVRSLVVVRDGRVVPGHGLGLTLACDHRILYGEHAGRFLARIAESLEHPET
ncbi:MAG: 2-oxo acid dehydrogenase subunit E2 [Solirubrobacteraceae bacterium]